MLNLFDADSFKNDTFISAVYAKRYRVTVVHSLFRLFRLTCFENI